MKFLRNDNSILEINANDISEIKVNINIDFKCQITFIADDLQFKKEFQMFPHERGGFYEEIFLVDIYSYRRYSRKYFRGLPL